MPSRGLVHAAHAAHAAHIGHGGHVLLGFGLFGNGAFGGQEQGSHGSGVLQSDTGHLLGVDDAGLDEVFVFAGSGVEAEAVLAFTDLFHNHGTFMASVAGDEAQGFFKGTADDVEAGQFVVVGGLDVVEVPPPGMMPSSTAARVALRASSTRSFFSFISVSVAAPT